MAIKITSVEPTALPQDTIAAHVAMKNFSWIDEKSGETGKSTRETMFNWLVNKKGQAYVVDNQDQRHYLFGARAPDGTNYVRAAQNGKWTDALLTLNQRVPPSDAASANE